MFTDRVEHSGPDGGPLEVREMPSDLEIARLIARVLLRITPVGQNSAIASEGNRCDTMEHDP